MLGFMWNYFAVDPEKKAGPSLAGSWEYSKKLTEEQLALDSQESFKIRGVMRAHQHTNTVSGKNGALMRLILNKDKALPVEDTGVGKLWLPVDEEGNQKKIEKGKLWDGIVCTFNVSPNAGYAMDRNSDNTEPLFDYDTHGILRVKPGGFANWALEVVRTKKMLLSQSSQKGKAVE